MEIIQEMGRSYLIIEDTTPQNRNYICQMLVNNNIDGLVNCQRGLYNNQSVLKYDITNMRPLSKEFDINQMSYDNLRSLFNEMLSAIKSGRTFLLEDSGYVFFPEYIYYDIETNKLKLIYIPFESDMWSDWDKQGHYYKLADYLLEHVNHHDEHAVSVAYQFYRMSKESLFSLDTFTSIIEKEKSRRVEIEEINSIKEEIDGSMMSMQSQVGFEEEEESGEDNSHKHDFILPIVLGVLTVIMCGVTVFVSVLKPYRSQLIMATGISAVACIIVAIKTCINYFKNKSNEELEVPVNDVTIDEFWTDDSPTQFFDDENTQFFDSTDDIKHTISWEENGKRRVKEIKSSEAVIGKKYDEVDLCISDASISRKHAKIKIDKGGLWIQDLSSTNGTFVNGMRLLAGENVKIDETSEIRFGKVLVSVV